MIRSSALNVINHSGATKGAAMGSAHRDYTLTRKITNAKKMVSSTEMDA